MRKAQGVWELKGTKNSLRKSRGLQQGISSVRGVKGGVQDREQRRKVEGREGKFTGGTETGNNV